MAFKRLVLLVSLVVSQFHFGSAAHVEKRTVKCPNGQFTANQACCALFPVVQLLQRELFDNGQCDDEAHGALRLAFHDAIGFSTNGGKGGGADGSILAFHSTETAYAANAGIDDIVSSQMPVFLQTKLSHGDFVHLAAAVGTSNCPGTPRLPFSFGRPHPAAPAPDHTVPEPTDSITTILARFADAGFVPPEVIWLLASHSIAAANKLDPAKKGIPFDSTPGTFDTQFFLEVLLKGNQFPGSGQHPGEVASPLASEMRLQSDFAFSQDSRTACFWQEAINNQTFIMGKFQTAMAKLQLLGQKNLIDCSDVIPVPKTFSGPIHYPPSFSQSRVQIACTSSPFPNIPTSKPCNRLIPFGPCF